MQNYELVHSSRVKFIYPSEEEMGDLTFIVAERKTQASAASSSSCSFNVLLYLLVFQVRISSSVVWDCRGTTAHLPSAAVECLQLQLRLLDTDGEHRFCFCTKPGNLSVMARL